MSKLTNIVKFLAMNRVTLLGYGFFTGGLAGLVIDFVKNDVETAGCSALSMLVGCYLFGITGFGKDTYNAYKDTKEHIQEHEKLDERFVNHHQVYCSRQGVYMAAKELGYLDDYKKAMKGKQGIIPNF